MFVGIDVAAAGVHCVALDANGNVIGAWLVGAGEIDRLPELLRGARAVAIDAPAQLSAAPHREDPTMRGKFKLARCAEVALARGYGYWVPWVAPADAPEGTWIATGLAVYNRLSETGADLLEVFPYAGFRVLAKGRALPKKTTTAGMRARIKLLAERGIGEPNLAVWSHDGLDALLAAVVAMDFDADRAQRAACSHPGADGSAIWLPAA